MENNKDFKSGFAVIVGRSNAGKSTLLNTLIGTKLAITSDKPQTTRHQIQGVLHDERGQVVFVDTPGIFAKKHDKLTQTLNEKARDSMQDIDVILYIVDPTRSIGNEEQIMIRMLEAVNIPKILVINKTDVYNPKYIEEYRTLAQDFDDMIEISALKPQHIRGLINLVFEYLKPGELIYPQGQITNVDNKFWFAEIIREKIFKQFGEEIPYHINVVVEDMETRDNGILYIVAFIEVNDVRYKKMVIGHGGRKIKSIGTSARTDLEKITGQKIFLDLEVRVNTRWVEQL